MPVPADQVHRVVFHADDFGMNAAVNQGILSSFRDGLLTSTSLLANAPAAEGACREWPPLIAQQDAATMRSCETRRELGEPSLPFDLGIHLNLSQGRPLTGQQYPATLLDQNGNFPGIGAVFYRLTRSRSEQLSLVAAELRAQIEWMCDHGLRPTHLNGHQYVELIPPIAAMVPELLQRYSIPIVRVARESGLARSVLFQGRVAAWGTALVKHYYAIRFRGHMCQVKAAFPERFFGTSHAGRIDFQVLSKFLNSSMKCRCTEIGLHPGNESSADDVSDPWFDPLRHLRSAERELLCCAELRDLLIDRRFNLGRLQLLRDANR